MARETSQTFDRGLQLLELLAAADDALTVTDLAEALGVARPVVYRLLATLEDHGLAAADDAGRYRAGLGLARLTGRVVPALRAAAEPHLRLLADKVGATAHLTMAEGDDGIAARRGRALGHQRPRGLPHRQPPPARPGRGGPGHPRGAERATEALVRDERGAGVGRHRPRRAPRARRRRGLRRGGHPRHHRRADHRPRRGAGRRGDQVGPRAARPLRSVRGSDTRASPSRT